MSVGQAVAIDGIPVHVGPRLTRRPACCGFGCTVGPTFTQERIDP